MQQDPVALAWSGRVQESFELACKQAAGLDPFEASQALEAFSVLGSQHRVRADDRVRKILLEKADDAPSLARRSFDAAMAMDERVLEPLAARLIASGRARWEVLRYAGELPSHALGKALARGWDAIPAELRDEALLTSCAMPCANAVENEAWGKRALECLCDPRESVRAAALVAMRVWAYVDAIEACRNALEDDSPDVQAEAQRTLAHLTRIAHAS
jgi:hypothetical protein